MATIFPDLSLHISPPAISVDGTSVTGVFFGEAATSISGRSEGDMGHDQAFLHHDQEGRELDHGEPTLSLGLEAPGSSVAADRHDLRHRDHHHQHHDQLRHPQIYGFKRNSRSAHGGKRSVRAPRMRWTTTLHAHFVHAVELLGGHESEHHQLKLPHRRRNPCFVMVRNKTVKSTDRGAAGQGPADMCFNQRIGGMEEEVEVEVEGGLPCDKAGNEITPPPCSSSLSTPTPPTPQSKSPRSVHSIHLLLTASINLSIVGFKVFS
ncbi:hypothetical protein BHE74_00052544 [Ensete ventricosum]|nr:hypothetical protein BHE74_00052544 [Ensete ventricosum]